MFTAWCGILNVSCRRSACASTWLRTNSWFALTKLPGSGKKTAERLLLELKDKLAPDLGSPSLPVSDAQADIVQALVAPATASTKPPADIAVAEGVKLALKALSK